MIIPPSLPSTATCGNRIAAAILQCKAIGCKPSCELRRDLQRRLFPSHAVQSERLHCHHAVALRAMGCERGLCRARAQLLPGEPGRQWRRRLPSLHDHRPRRRRQDRPQCRCQPGDGHRPGHVDRVLQGERLQRDNRNSRFGGFLLCPDARRAHADDRQRRLCPERHDGRGLSVGPWRQRHADRRQRQRSARPGNQQNLFVFHKGDGQDTP